MKLHIAYPAAGTQTVLNVEDERIIRAFVDKRMSHQVEADVLGDAWKGYVLKISGGNDLQGFPMKQGVLTTGRVRLLLSKGHSCYRPRCKGERKRKSVRGCIVSAQLSVLNLVIVKKGDNDIAGLTDTVRDRSRGPKRASNIRKLFNITKTREVTKKDKDGKLIKVKAYDHDVKKFVIRRTIEKDGKKPYTVAPRIQRLVTPTRLARKRAEKSIKVRRATKSKQEAEAFGELLHKRKAEFAANKAALAKKRSLSRKLSEKKAATA